MDQQTDVRGLIERGEVLLRDEQAAQAAVEFARAVQLDPSAVGGHLGLAEANLALGQFGIVYMACRQVQQLAPQSAEAALASGLLALLDRRYDVALAEADRSVAIDPTRAYTHLLRAACFRRLNQSYDASLAEARAARLGGSRDTAYLFPVAEAAASVPGQVPLAPGGGAAPSAGAQSKWEPPIPGVPQRIAYAPQRPWEERSAIERRMTRLRFATRRFGFVTLILLVVNIGVYLATALLSKDLFNPFLSPNNGVFVDPRTQLFLRAMNPIYSFGVQQGLLIQQDPAQIYRLFTAMFLHENIAHVGFNMVSLYFVGVVTEQIFGSWRFTVIYLVSGVVAGALQAAFVPSAVALGASGAIFGIFGAFGAFILLRRRSLGPAGNSIIGQWFFFLVINLVFSVIDPQIALYDHIGGLVAGLILGTAAMLTMRPRRA